MKKKKKLKKIFGTNERPRLAIFRSACHVYAQIIDDVAGKTLVSASSLKIKNGGGIEAAKKVGKEIAEKALSKGIKTVVFDRGGFQYVGRVKNMADAAREGGLVF